MNITKFYISSKKYEKYRLPVIIEVNFSSPKKLGSYCASNGTLWLDLNSKELFDNRESAKREIESMILNYLNEI